MKTSEKKQKISPGKCQKCASLGYGVSLVGGYNGTFCDPHLNEWHEIVIDKPEFEAYVVKAASRDALVYGGIANQYSRDLTEELIDHQSSFYRLAKAWAEEEEIKPATEVRRGLYNKYIVLKTSGESIDPKAVYFPLRLDKDPHARTAAMAYAVSVNYRNPTLSDELRDLVDRIEGDLIKRSKND